MSSNPSHDVLREQLNNYFNNYYNGGDSIVIPVGDGDPADWFMELFAAHTEEKVREARIDELNNLPDCNIESKFHGSTNVVLVEDVIARIKALTNKGKGEK